MNGWLNDDVFPLSLICQAPEVSKRASEMWKALSAEDRLHWDNEAAKEKQRYLAEKEVYTGPVSFSSFYIFLWL